MKRKNPVAQHGRKFNRAAVFRDRKQEAKRGLRKHKKAPLGGAFFLPAAWRSAYLSAAR
ncbi:DUF7230 family protein [Magnetovirga frankeli]|uniref:DUF7230 family protein n=1 Tax=Magnetovirga frankeli TaxID=947516 RepID=UPI003D330914